MSLVLLNIKLTLFGNKSIVHHMIMIILRGAVVVKEWRLVFVFESLVTLISSQIRWQWLSLVSCFVELKPRDMKYITLDDGRKLCLECLDSAIMDTNECQPLFQFIKEFYEGLNMKIEQQIPLLLVERQALNEAMESERNVQELLTLLIIYRNWRFLSYLFLIILLQSGNSSPSWDKRSLSGRGTNCQRCKIHRHYWSLTLTLIIWK